MINKKYVLCPFDIMYVFLLHFDINTKVNIEMHKCTHHFHYYITCQYNVL